MTETVFLFDLVAVSTLRELAISDVPNCTTFELIVAAMWRARILSLKLEPSVEVRLTFPVNARNKFNPPIPNGYYGNVVTVSTAMATAGELKAQPITHAVELVKKAKIEVTEDYMRSMIDMLALRGHPPIAIDTNFIITDFRWLGIDNADYGWGKPAYGSLATGIWPHLSGFFSCLIPVENSKGEHEIEFSMSLPEPVLDLFVKELDIMMGHASICRTWKKATTTLFCWEPC